MEEPTCLNFRRVGEGEPNKLACLMAFRNIVKRQNMWIEGRTLSNGKFLILKSLAQRERLSYDQEEDDFLKILG